MLHNCMLYDPIQRRGHGAQKVVKMADFKVYLLHLVCVCVYCFAVFSVVCFFWVFFTFVAFFSFNTLILLVGSFDL